jgi:hypothetical protein
MGVADDNAGILNTVAGSALVISLAVDNAANNAAGTGIRLSKAGITAAIAVNVNFLVNADPVSFDDAMVGSLAKDFYVRG